MPCGGWLFLRHALPQCRCNITGKLVKSTSTFAWAEDIVIIVHDLGAVGTEAGEDFSSFHHANFTLHSPRGLHASYPVTLPEDCWDLGS